jgi:glycerol-3-phosphate O-acyltransferase/dihydroxyacetone phosphate acyltransferase
MIYEILRFIFSLVLNLFFREIKVRGFHNIPIDDPVLFVVAPHANQFIDPLLLVMTCARKVGFLAAKKSMDKNVIGFFGRSLNSIPVERPQDLIKKGEGTIYIDGSNPLMLRGIDTKFSNYSGRYTINLPKDVGSSTISTIISDTELLLSKEFEGDKAKALLEQVDTQGNRIGTMYTVTPHVDQSKMFTEVVKRLSRNSAVGIFPEGGSHDRPEMLPLKAGVSVMALETLAKFPGTKLKIVPVGLHYFHADKV